MTARFVQFPHPGSEHVPDSDVMPWNVSAHRRKFLTAQGRYVDTKGTVRSGEVVLWGEWEPPSDIVRRWPKDGRLPRALHRPFWGRLSAPRARQNTDPWVFGNQMLYSNCRQISTTSMRRLPVGSVICFGSTIDRKFCVDTVFVVASAQPWTVAEMNALDVDEAFMVCTIEAIADLGIDPCTQFTLYRGATLDAPVHGMYSFTPARPADHPQFRFSRPVVQLSDRINPANWRSTQGSLDHLPITDVQGAWAELRQQILDADLVLATHLATPPQEVDPGHLQDSKPELCGKPCLTPTVVPVC